MLTALKNILRNKRLTQRALAKATGLPEVRVCRIVRGRFRSRRREQRLIAEFLGVRRATLFPRRRRRLNGR